MSNIKITVIIFLTFYLGIALVNAQSQIPSELAGLCGICDDCVNMMTTGLVENACSNQSPLYYSNTLWIPNNNDEIKYVRVNFVFLHKQNDGLGNFVSGNQEHETIINELVSQINTVYSNLSNPSDSNCHVTDGFISDTKIRIVPNIIHYTDPYYWNNENDPDPICSTAWLDSLDEQIVNNPSIEKAINIYFTENATEFNNLVVYQNTQDPPATIVGCSYPPNLNDLVRSSRIHMPGVFSKYYWMKNYAPTVYNEPWDTTIHGWFITSVGNQIAHELGHSLSLMHVIPCQYNLMAQYPINGLFHAFLTPTEIGQIHRHLSISSIRKYTTDDSFLSTPYEITTDTEWDLNFTSYRNVIVESGFTLTITCKLVMKSNAKIIVKPGGKLVVDGGIITTEDSRQWQGIEVWGNSSTHQSSINGVCGQGWLELRNGAVIENAKCAVELWRPDYWTTTGGVIHASDATFRNNAMAVRAVCYQNYHPYTHVPLNYNAYFNNCSFIVDNDYLGTETFQKHVVLAEVDGIAFSGCDFSANRSVSGVDPWCIGISAYDAHFSVTSPCTTNNTPCPDEEMDHSTFTGLCSGIRASSDGRHPRSFTVRNTLFINNDFGIHAENTDFPTILFNDFRIGGICDFNYGVCLRNVTGFCIEENLFRPYSKSKTTTVGIAVYHSNGVNDIYRNTFLNLSRANLALGQNTTGGTNSTLLGLTYSCNDFNGNQRDIMVLQRDGAGDIQSQQGSSSCPSGNTYSNSIFQIYNDGLHQIDYYYNSSEADETPTPSLLYRVNRYGTTNANACATHYGNSPIVKSPSEKSALEAEYLSAYNAYSDLRLLYESHMDNSGAQDPTADNSTTTEMLQIGAQMAHFSHEYRLAAGDIIRSNLNDSIANPTELRTWLGNMNDIAADRMAISSYLQEGDSASAFALANTLPALYGLQGSQLSDHEDYIRLLQLHQTLNSTHRNVFQLTQKETDLVAGIADNGNGVSQSMARAMMEQLSSRETSSCIDPELPDSERGEKGWNGYTGVASNRATASDVTLSPNPATTWTTVNYTLPGNTTKAVLTLTNMLGVNVLTKELEDVQGNKVIDLRGLATGVYVYTIQYEQFTETGKLVITK